MSLAINRLAATQTSLVIHSKHRCDSLVGTSNTSDLGLRIAALFVIFVGSTLGALFPVLARRCVVRKRQIPDAVFDFAKFFGSGVIIGTAFIHLLAPGIEALSSSCLSEAWQKYPYAPGLCLLSILSIFVVEIITGRCGTAHLAKLRAHQAEDLADREIPLSPSHTEASDAGNNARLVGIVILEFGAILHRNILNFPADPKFKLLFVVLVLHQVFEGLGIGSRLASVDLPARYNYVPIVGAVIFGLSTPMGLAVGLAVRTAYSPDDPSALIVSGVLDSLSAGILIYTGIVELLAHEILFNEELIKGPVKKLTLALMWVLLGCTMMAILGRWV
ncbi:ZIP zinc/iron transport family [Mycena galericulata]|nr:ZIP zinc/iron transport family [Mycena galericulata]